MLEEKTFRRLGGRDEIHVDVRIVAATDKDVEGLIRAGRFKEELFCRLNVVRRDGEGRVRRICAPTMVGVTG